MKGNRGVSFAFLLMGVAFILQGCNKTVVENVQNQVNEWIQVACTGAVDLLFEGLKAKGTELITKMCEGLPAGKEACLSAGESALSGNLTTQKINQTQVCVTKMQSMFNVSSLTVPDETAISTAVANFEKGESGFDTAWLTSLIEQIKDGVTGKTAPATGRLYVAQKQIGAGPSMPRVNNSAGGPSMITAGLLAGVVMMVGFIAFGIKRFRANRGARDTDCELQEDEIE